MRTDTWSWIIQSQAVHVGMEHNMRVNLCVFVQEKLLEAVRRNNSFFHVVVVALAQSPPGAWEPLMEAVKGRSVGKGGLFCFAPVAVLSFALDSFFFLRDPYCSFRLEQQALSS